ncbi:MAG: hypothetical protein IJ672_08455 [Methanobrevibacter sp.]|nr:hypothetical protein [Methanobrevibacter sp.]
MSIETPKLNEIKRLTTPLTFKNQKAYDNSGNEVKISETLSDVRLVVEPKNGILSDDEVLQYAPLSKLASAIRLKKGIGNSQDVLYIKESLPWYLGLYYVVLICISFAVTYAKNTILMFILLILTIIPLIYLYYIFKLDKYKKVNTSKKQAEVTQATKIEKPIDNYTGLDSLKEYKKEINNLHVVFDVKQEVVRGLIKKRFEPPQITYDKFIKTIDNAEKLFLTQEESALNIINLAAEDTQRVRSEIDSKIESMKRIINQIEDLTNELVINISSDDNSGEDVKNLIDDMENLIGSVKDY